MKEYTQLTQPQRYEISALHIVGQGPTQIARIVGVHRTTISRELKRNRSPNGYYPQAAHQRSKKRRTDRSRPLKWTGRCRRIVEGKLRHEWSPEQITGWLGRNETFTISHERIYQHIHLDQDRGGRLHTHLRQQQHPKRISSKTAYKGSIRHRISIDDRAAIVDGKNSNR